MSDSPEAQSALFRNIRFWVAQRIPFRTAFLEKVRDHGGTVVPLEQNADILIADHVRKDCPPGSYSWTWVDASIKEGELQNKEEHRAGPDVGYSRPVGSARPAKAASRNAYSVEDDRILYEWVEDAERKGLQVKGNEIYKQLEQVNPRHPWQSWRDRYIKYVSGRPPPPRLERTPATNPTQTGNTGAAILPTDTRQNVPQSTNSPEVILSRTTERAQVQKITRHSPEDKEPNPQHHQNHHAEAMNLNADPATPQREVSTRGNSSTDHGGVSELPEVDMVHLETPSVRGPTLPVSPTPPKLRPSLSAPTFWRSADAAEDRERLAYLDTIFTQHEHDELMSQATVIQNVVVSNYEAAWATWAEHHPQHDVHEWVEFYQLRVLPKWKDRQVVKFIEQRKTLAISESVNAIASQANIGVLRDRIPAPSVVGGESAESNSTATATTQDETPTRRTMPVVVIESPSAQQKQQYSLSPADNIQSPEGRTGTRFSPRKRRKLDSDLVTRTSPQENASAPQNTSEVDDSSIINTVRAQEATHLAPQVASQALSRALNSRQPAPPSSAMVVIDLVDVPSDDDLDDGGNKIAISQQVLPSALTRHEDFDVYESNDIPEGDEENMPHDGNGSITTTPRRHVRGRSREALAALPLNFKVEPGGEASTDDYHDIEDLDEEMRDDDDEYADADDQINELEAEEFLDEPLEDSRVSESSTSDQQLLREAEEAMTRESARNSRASTAIPLFHGTGIDKAQITINHTETAEDEVVIQLDEVTVTRHAEEEAQTEDVTHAEVLVVQKPDIVNVDTSISSPVIVAVTDGEAMEPRSNNKTAESSDSDGSIKLIGFRQRSQQAREDYSMIQDEEVGCNQGEDNANYARADDSSEDEEQSVNMFERDTQAILNQLPLESDDLQIPEPPEDTQEDDDEHALIKHPIDFLTADTQAILAANTQQFDAEEFLHSEGPVMEDDRRSDSPTSERPPNDGAYSTAASTNDVNGFDFTSSPPRLSTPSKPPNAEHSTHSAPPIHNLNPSTTTNPQPDMDPDELFTAQQLGLGSTLQDINYAWTRTTLDTRLARQVLVSLRQGKGLPQNVPGIWTEEEDQVLRGGDARMMRRLEERHGLKKYAERVEFLEEMAGD